MPLSLKAMAIRSRRVQEKLQLSTELSILNNSIRQLKPRQTTKLFNLMTDIHQRCGNYPTSTRRYPAQDFDDLRESYSPPTVIKAKRVLGIRSVRRDGAWYWTPPKRTPEEAMQQRFQDRLDQIDEAKQELIASERQVCKELREVMQSSHYFALNTDVLKEMERRGYQRGTVLHAKASLKIATIPREKMYYWVWQDQDIQAWLEAALADGPVPISELNERAMNECGWHPEVIKMAKEVLGTIRYKVMKGKVHWYNLSDPLEREKPDARVPTSVTQRKGYIIKDYMPEAARAREEDQDIGPVKSGATRSITVDFTEEPEATTEIIDGEEYTIETLDGTHKVEKHVSSAGPGLPNIITYKEK